MITEFNLFESNLTSKQREVLNMFIKANAIDEESATNIGNWYVVKHLVNKGILNTKNGQHFWIRQENEDPTGLFNVVVFYILPSNHNIKHSNKDRFIIVDDKKYELVILRYNSVYKFTDILKSISKKFNCNQNEIRLDGMEMDFWNKTKFPRFDFNGREFIKV